MSDKLKCKKQENRGQEERSEGILNARAMFLS